MKTATRILNYGSGPPDDGLEREWDICPTCGNARWQLYLVLDRFYCDWCRKSTARNDKPPPPPEPEQIELQVNSKVVQNLEERPQSEKCWCDGR